MEHVAIDLGRPTSVLCEKRGDGKKHYRRFRLDRGNLSSLFSQRARCRVLVESSTEAEWVAAYLEGLGHEVVVADPNYAAMYGERNRRVKTGNRDASALYDANVLGIYRPAHRRSPEQRRVMALLGVRGSLVRTRTRWINVVRALVYNYNVPVGAGYLSRAKRQQIRQLQYARAGQHQATFERFQSMKGEGNGRRV